MSDVRIQLSINIPFVVDLIGECADFDDPYTDGDYAKFGCYGCKYLASSCVRGHSISCRRYNLGEDGPMLYCEDHNAYNKSSPYLVTGCEHCRYRRGSICVASHEMITLLVREDD